MGVCEGNKENGKYMGVCVWESERNRKSNGLKGVMEGTSVLLDSIVALNGSSLTSQIPVSWTEYIFRDINGMVGVYKWKSYKCPHENALLYVITFESIMINF